MTGGVTGDGWSRYDEDVPHVTGLPAVRRRTDELRAARSAVAEVPDLAAARELVVVVSSSRGGSSLFGELLRRVPGLLHLRAESNPFFALGGLYAGPRRREVLAAELALDIGQPDPAGAVDDAFALDLAWRVLVQWPAAADRVGTDDVVGAASAAATGAAFDRDRFHLRVLDRLRRIDPSIDPWYYDLPADAVAAAAPGLPVPAGPPGPALVEMPPFVLLQPWRRATTEDLASMPLVLTTPRNTFRLDLFADLFPKAELRVVHLTRNPAAAVNGLSDGWLHPGFFNCEVGRPLAISGYSDVVPGGRSWWCYDIPPGWTEWTTAALADVCAFQWRATHEEALASIDRLGCDHLRIRFEDVVGPPAERSGTLDRLAAWLRIEPPVLASAADGLPPVMATAPPARRRWEARRGELEGVLADDELRELAARLGYGLDGSDWD